MFDIISDMKLFVLLLAFKLDTLPPAPTLHAVMDAHQDAVLAAQLEEFQTNQTGFWMNYMPSAGIAYTPSGAPRPAISFSLSQLFNAKRQRSEQAAKRKAIISNSEIERQQAHRELDARISRYEWMELELQVMREVHKINVSLYQLALSDYETAKIPPSVFLPKKKSFLEAGLNLTRKEMELKNLEMEVLTFANY